MTGTDERPKIHAKQISILVSVGTDDRDRNMDEFIEAARTALVNAASAHNVTVANSYYILDGKVCLVDDYDEATQNRKPGTFPPPWAGGPDPVHVKPERRDIGKAPTSKRQDREAARQTQEVDGALNDALVAVQTAQEASA